MDEESIVELENQQLLAVNETEEIPILRSILSNDQTSKSEESTNNSLRSLAKRVFVIKVIVVFVACISLIIWITPTPPTVHLHSMQISFSDHNLPVWSATFTIKNPNEKFNVKNPSVCLLHRRRLVWSVKVKSFEQNSGEEKEIFVKGDETGVVDEAAVREIEKEVAVRGKVVDLDMVFRGRVGFSSSFWGEQNMTSVCNNVKAKLFNDDKIKKLVMLFDGRQNCRVHLPMLY